ncbi:MAG: large-conductance mechanosensitive channel protein MscL [Gammaproteobacteria bacterium]
MSVLNEFKQFAMRGNVVDLAVAVVIGGAFGKIVSSLVGDIVMPVLGLLVSGIDFADLAITLKPAVGDQPAVLLTYGNFLKVTVDFIIIALAIFFIVKGINRFKRKEEATPAPPPAPSAEEKLLTEIRDLLKSRGA